MPSTYNSKPHLDYYLGQDEVPLDEVAEQIIVKYGGDYEMLKQYFKQVLDQELLETFDEFIGIQSQGYDLDPYSHGMANGMIFMKSLVDDKQPHYFEAPEVWARDRVAGFIDLVELALEEF